MPSCAIHGDYPQHLAHCPQCPPSTDPAAPRTRGAVLLLPVLLSLPFIAVIFPLASLLTLLTGYLLKRAIFGDTEVSGLATTLTVALPCVLVFLLALLLERRAEGWLAYRRARHWIRILGVGYLCTRILQVLLYADEPSRVLAPYPLLGIAAAMLATHFVFRYLDRRGNRAGSLIAWWHHRPR